MQHTKKEIYYDCVCLTRLARFDTRKKAIFVSWENIRFKMGLYSYRHVELYSRFTVNSL